MGLKQVSTALHDGTIGDVWAALASLKAYHRLTKKKVIFYLTNGKEATYYEGATHPTRSDSNKNTMVMLNKTMIKMMIPLIKAQPYIEDAREHDGEKIHINLNKIRETFVNQPYHSLAKWYFYVYPDLTIDLSKPYIHAPDTKTNFAKGKIIIARTERYTNPNIDYLFLKEHQKNMVFAGTDLEHRLFNARFYTKIPRLQIKNFLELAQAIKQSNGVISNQTQIAQIAEGLKVPRVVELCSYAPNVDFVGKDGYEFYAQDSLEYFFNKLIGNEKRYMKNMKIKMAAVAAAEAKKKPAETGFINLQIPKSIIE